MSGKSKSQVTMGRPKILLAQRAEVEFYPPVLNQAAILSDFGDVTVVDSASIADGAPESPDGSHQELSRSGNELTRSLRGLVSYMKFASRLKQVARQGFDIAVGFEPEAAGLILCQPVPKKVVHLHEFPSVETYSSRAARRGMATAARNAFKADAIVVPGPHNSVRLMEMWNLDRPPTVVLNCPRTINQLPKSRLHSWLRERGVGNVPVVYYQGAIGASHGLEDVIQSISSWRREAILVLVGPASESYRARLEELANRAGVASRLFFVGVVPYQEVFSFAVGATVAINLLDTKYENFAYCAGGSNKRFEYIALGIPQVTSAGPGIDELFVSRGVATSVKYGDREDISRKISDYLEFAELRECVAEKCRRLHLSEYNYEHQFQPVLDQVFSNAPVRVRR